MWSAGQLGRQGARRTSTKRIERVMSSPSVESNHTRSRHDQIESATPCELSIVIPCLNEAETLATCVRKARDAIARLGIDGEVIVADNGSTDDSREIAVYEGARLVPVPTRGYGAALHGGIGAANGKYIIMGDADDSYDFSEIGGFVERLRAGHDMVMGNRFAGRIMPGAMPFLHQYLGNPGITLMGRLLFGSRCGDFYCGLRGFTKAAWLRFDQRTTGMEYAIEMVTKATLMGMNVTEVPIILHKDGRSRPPHLRTWRDGWRTLRFMLVYSPTWLYVLPGSALLLIGLALFLWLLPGPRTVGGVTFDVHTMLAAAGMVFLGFQVLSFGALARVFFSTVGLIPENQREPRVVQALTLEGGIISGLALLVVGVALLVWALATWAGQGFGPLNYSFSMRQVIPAVLLLVLGTQAVFNSFFLSLLRLPRR
jgi:hypothetical protein